MRYDAEHHILCIPKYRVADFMSYLNAFSLHKWKKYTNLQAVKLHFRIQGSCLCVLWAYIRCTQPCKTGII